MNVYQASQVVLAEVAAEQSANSLKTYQSHAKTVAKHFGPDTDLADITRAKVQAWVTEQRPLVAPATIRHRLSFVSRLYRVALDHDLDIRNPTEKLRLPQVNNQRDRTLARDEEAALRSVLTPEAFTVLEFAWQTGLRRLEQWRLRPEDIKLWVTRTIETKSGPLPIYNGMARIRTSKTGKPGTCPLNPVAATIALVWKKREETYLFGPQVDDRLAAAVKWCRQNFGPACKKAGIKDLHWHDLRHTAATRAIHNGARPEEVRQLLRHGDLKQTDRYIQWGDSPAWSAARAISSR